MEAPQSILPTTDEIEHQLHRMLRSKVFSTRKKPARLLELLVKRALTNTPVAEKDILAALFPANDYSLGTTAARTNASYTRQLLEQYYNEFGKDDPVIIKFPQSQSVGKGTKRTANYRPTFTYHANHDAYKTYLIGTRQQSLIRPTALDRAAECFAAVLAIQPDHGAANLAMAETLLLGKHIMQHDVKAPLHVAEYASRAVSHNPQDWKAHAIYAATRLIVYRDEEGAANAFEIALTLNSHETQRCGWFHAFLFARCLGKEGLALAKVVADENPDSPFTLAMYGIWLYLEANFEEANRRFSEAYELDRSCWLALVGAALADISLGNPDLAAAKLHAFQRPFDDFSWWADGLDLVCKCYGDLSSGYGWKRGEGSTAYFHDGRLLDGKDKQEVSSFVDPAWATFQSAVFFMAQRNFERAVDFLESAVYTGEAWTLWLHTMAIFVPLVENDRFQALIRRLPAAPIPE